MNAFPPPGDKKQLEEGLVFTPKFDADGPVKADDLAEGGFEVDVAGVRHPLEVSLSAPLK